MRLRSILDGKLVADLRRVTARNWFMTDSTIVLDYRMCLENLPGLHYIAGPSGNIEFLSEDLRAVLECPPEESLSYGDLFSEEDLREVHAALENTTVNQTVHLKHRAGVDFYVHHSARIVTTGGADRLVLGAIRRIEHEFELQQQVAVYQRMLNEPDIPFGVHFVDRGAENTGTSATSITQGAITWLNDWSKKRFFPEQNPEERNAQRAVWDLAGPIANQHEVLSEPEEVEQKKITKERERITTRVAYKFAGGEESNMVPREYYAVPDFGNIKKRQALPFIIKDFFIYDSPIAIKMRRPCRIATVVKGAAIASNLIDYLIEQTPRSPVLEELGICAFVKRIDKISAIRFEYVNSEFEDKNPPPDDLLKCLGVQSSQNDRSACWKELISKGITDEQLYPKEIAHRYNADDMKVFNTNSALQGLEPHPTPPKDQRSASYRESSVQFVKVPLRENDTTVGVMGFYWNVENTQGIERRLSQMLAVEKNEIFECLPDLMRVVRKDLHKQILFVNKHHADAHGRAARWFVGRKDCEINEFGDHMKIGYEQDDDYVVKNGKAIARWELHRDNSESAQYNVLTIKSPIRSQADNSVKGVQCLYWSKSGLDKLLRETPAIETAFSQSVDGHSDVFISYAHEDKGFLNGSDHAQQVKLNGFRPHLVGSKFSWWVDTEVRRDEFCVEIAEKIRQCRVFVLFLSSAFWASKYVLNTELPRIQLRKLENPSVQIIPVILREFLWNNVEMQAWVREFDIVGGVEGEHSVVKMASEAKEDKVWQDLMRKITRALEA